MKKYSALYISYVKSIDIVRNVLMGMGFDCVREFYEEFNLKKFLDTHNEYLPDLIVIEVWNEIQLDVCRQLKNIKQMQNIPTIVITALVDKEFIDRIMELDATTYISAPVQIQQFSELVEAYILDP